MKNVMDEKIQKLNKIDTPTITNVIATYPHDKELCLGLYNPWKCNWYTDSTCKCIFPELGRRSGYAVTVIFGEYDHNFSRLTFADVLKAVDQSPKPVILIAQQNMPEETKVKNGLFGGIMTTALKKCGCIGCISDGPSRDIDEIRPMEFQYMLTGVCAGHGEFGIQAVNVPVSVCGMDVAPGEFIHMDENGAVKFPADKVDEVIEYAEKALMAETTKKKNIENAENIEELIRAMEGSKVTKVY